MVIVGLTGGIGSGKTTIGKCFASYGIPVYIADIEAKALMNRSKVIKKKLITLFGASAYKDGQLNTSYLASKIFTDKTLLSQMNAIVHPKVATHFKRWLKKQDAPYIVKEVAIIFENNLENQYNYIITVVADEELRIARVIKRDAATRKKVTSIIKNQLPDEQKIEKSDFVIVNNDLDVAIKEIRAIHTAILTRLM